MDFVLRDGNLTQLILNKQNKRFRVNKNVLITRNLWDNYSLIINSFLDVCIITDDYHSGTLDCCFQNFLFTPLNGLKLCEKEYFKSTNDSKEKYENEVTFILTITYKCNLRCVYCFQQNSKTLKREKMTFLTLDYLLKIIKEFIVSNPNKNVHIGLFGGEPLLQENEDIIDTILDFCRENKIKLSITSNGVGLPYYLKKLIIHRSLIDAIELTIDSIETKDNTRFSTGEIRNKTSYNNVVENIKELTKYNVFVSISTLFDKNNLENMYQIYKEIKKIYEANGHIDWHIGRVDDRLYETNFPNIIDEVDILEKYLSLKINDDFVHLSILKTTHSLCKKINTLGNQLEAKGNHNYCWCTSQSDYVFYIDRSLLTYRCPCTVGREEYSIGKFSSDFLKTYKINTCSYLDFKKCQNCSIGGYCSGGCFLSREKDWEQFCEKEKNTFNKFIDLIFTKRILKIINEEYESLFKK